MSLIYELDIKDSIDRKDIDISVLSEFQLEVLDNYINNKSLIDEKISASLVGWKIDSIAKVELALLRLSLTEILYVEEVPYKVSINEAIEISKQYADDKAPKFINGIMRKCVDELNLY